MEMWSSPSCTKEPMGRQRSEEIRRGARALHCHPDYICSSNHPLTPGSKATCRSRLGHPDGLYPGSEWELGPAPEQQLPPTPPTRPWVGHEVSWILRGREGSKDF